MLQQTALIKIQIVTNLQTLMCFVPLSQSPPTPFKSPLQLPFKESSAGWLASPILVQIMERSTLKSAFKTRDQLKDKNSKASGSPKASTRENTKPVDFKLHTEQRAVKRAMFNYSVATKLYLLEIQKRQVEKLQKMIEDEEVRLLRKEMVPKAQLMPFFDKPFHPQRSNRPLTIPKEPSLRTANTKCWSCISENELCYYFQHAHVLNPIK